MGGCERIFKTPIPLSYTRCVSLCVGCAGACQRCMAVLSVRDTLTQHAPGGSVACHTVWHGGRGQLIFHVVCPVSGLLGQWLLQIHTSSRYAEHPDCAQPDVWQPDLAEARAAYWLARNKGALSVAGDQHARIPWPWHGCLQKQHWCFPVRHGD